MIENRPGFAVNNGASKSPLVCNVQRLLVIGSQAMCPVFYQ